MKNIVIPERFYRQSNLYQWILTYVGMIQILDDYNHQVGIVAMNAGKYTCRR